MGISVGTYPRYYNIYNIIACINQNQTKKYCTFSAIYVIMYIIGKIPLKTNFIEGVGNDKS